MKAATRHPDALPDSFEALNRLHPLRPIKDEADYDNAVELVDQLAVVVDPNVDQTDYLVTLSELVSRYDEEHYPPDPDQTTPLEALRYLMALHEMNGSALGELLGNRALGSKILRGERQLSKTHIRILCDHFRVNPSLFL